jgi:hypothetical protein
MKASIIRGFIADRAGVWAALSSHFVDLLLLFDCWALGLVLGSVLSFPFLSCCG